MEGYRYADAERRPETKTADQTEVRELMEQHHDTGSKGMAYDFLEGEVEE